MPQIGPVMRSVAVVFKAHEVVLMNSFRKTLREILKDPRLLKQMRDCGVVKTPLIITGVNGSLNDLDNAAKLSGLEQDEIKAGDIAVLFVREDHVNEDAHDINVCAGIFQALVEELQEETKRARSLPKQVANLN